MGGQRALKDQLCDLGLEEELAKLFFNLILKFQSASFGFIRYFSTLHCLNRTSLKLRS